MASAVTFRAKLYAAAGRDSFALAAGVGVFATRFTSASKRLAAPGPSLASRAKRASVSLLVSVFFMDYGQSVLFSSALLYPPYLSRVPSGRIL